MRLQLLGLWLALLCDKSATASPPTYTNQNVCKREPYRSYSAQLSKYRPAREFCDKIFPPPVTTTTIYVSATRAPGYGRSYYARDAEAAAQPDARGYQKYTATPARHWERLRYQKPIVKTFCRCIQTTKTVIETSTKYKTTTTSRVSRVSVPLWCFVQVDIELTISGFDDSQG